MQLNGAQWAMQMAANRGAARDRSPTPLPLRFPLLLLPSACRCACALPCPRPYAITQAAWPLSLHCKTNTAGYAAPLAGAALLCLLLPAAAQFGGGGGGAGALEQQVPGNAVLDPGFSYSFKLGRFRLKLSTSLEDCSLLCQVEVGCVGWTWGQLLRTCTLGYEFSGLPPARDAGALSGRPAQVFSPANIDCAARVDVGVAYTARLLAQRGGRAETVGACAADCAEAGGCVAWTWNRALQSCALKFALTGGTLPNDDSISGLVGPCAVNGGGGGGGGGAGGAPLLPAGAAPKLEGTVSTPPPAGGLRPPPGAPATPAQQQLSGRAAVSVLAARPNARPGAGANSNAPLPAPAKLPADKCKGLSLDAAFDNAVRDVGEFAKQAGGGGGGGGNGANAAGAAQFAQALQQRKGDVLKALKESLKDARPGDKRALQLAVEAAVQAKVPGALRGAVDVDGVATPYPTLVWRALSGEPFVANCY